MIAQSKIFQMTRPSNLSIGNGDLDLANVLNSRDFQDLLETLASSRARDDSPPASAVEALSQYLRENYGIDLDADEPYDSDSDDSIELRTADDLLTERMMQAIVSGQREIPMRRILPTSPPPSPIPNPALHPFSRHPPPLPPRRRSRLAESFEGGNVNINIISQQQRFTRFADPNASEESKSPHSGISVPFSPLDRNNDLPLTSEFMHRYGRRKENSVPFDAPER